MCKEKRPDGLVDFNMAMSNTNGFIYCDRIRINVKRYLFTKSTHRSKFTE